MARFFTPPIAPYPDTLKECGVQPPDPITYRFNYLNIFLLVAAIITAVMLIRKNWKHISTLLQAVFSFLKKHSLSVFFVLFILGLLASLSISARQAHQFTRGMNNLRRQFYYTTSQEDPTYWECKRGVYGRLF